MGSKLELMGATTWSYVRSQLGLAVLRYFRVELTVRTFVANGIGEKYQS